MEDTKSTIIVCHESGEQFVPGTFLCTYKHGDNYEGIWKTSGGETTFGRLRMIEKTIEGVRQAFQHILDDLEAKREQIEGINGK